VSSARLFAARARANISSADRYLSGFLMALMLRIHPLVVRMKAIEAAVRPQGQSTARIPAIDFVRV
jgi:hypothetical protein